MTINFDIAVSDKAERESSVHAPFDRQPLGHAASRSIVPAFKKGGNGGFALAYTLASRECGAILPVMAKAIDALGGKQYGASGARSWLNASTLGHDVGLGVVSHYAPIGVYLASVEAQGGDAEIERACLLESQRKAGDALSVLVVRALLLDSERADWPAQGKKESKREYRMRLTRELATRQVFAHDGAPAPQPCDATNGKPIVYAATAIETPAPKAKRATRKPSGK